MTSWHSHKNFLFHLNFPFLDLVCLKYGGKCSSWAGSECKHPYYCRWHQGRWSAATGLGPDVNTQKTATAGLGPSVNTHQCESGPDVYSHRHLLLEFWYSYSSLLATIIKAVHSWFNFGFVKTFFGNEKGIQTFSAPSLLARLILTPNFFAFIVENSFESQDSWSQHYSLVITKNTRDNLRPFYGLRDGDELTVWDGDELTAFHTFTFPLTCMNKMTLGWVQMYTPSITFTFIGIVKKWK